MPRLYHVIDDTKLPTHFFATFSFIQSSPQKTMMNIAHHHVEWCVVYSLTSFLQLQLPHLVSHFRLPFVFCYTHKNITHIHTVQCTVSTWMMNKPTQA